MASAEATDDLKELSVFSALSRVFTTFRAIGPEIDATVKRPAVAQLGATIPSTFGDISTVV